MTYRTIVADPPWVYTRAPVTGKRDRKAAAFHFYPCMAVEDIAALPVSTWANDNAHLYLWTTNNHFPEAFAVMDAWGFAFKTILTWNKTGPLGLGQWFRARTEHVLFGVRGRLPIEPSRREPNIFSAANRHQHSMKPDAFYDLVERVSPGPYLELFSRRARFGWDYWGNESLGTAEVA